MEIHRGLLKGSLVLLIAFNIYNALNFFYHFTMVRLLTVVNYGILATLFSIIYALAVFSESIQLVITKYSSIEENKGKLKNLLKKTLNKSFIVSLGLLALYLLLSIPLSPLLKIPYSLMALNGLVIILYFVTPVTRGVLQGRKKFNSLGFNMIIEATTKLLIAIALVFIGWKVFGAILGMILGVLIAFIFSFFSLQDITKSKEEKAETSGIYGYTKPTFIIMLVILIFFSADIIIARLFFTEELAGSYAIASILAKTIFFGTQPISRAMFPLSAENNKDKKKSENVFANALTVILLAITAALVLFYFFPGLIIQIFSGKVIPESVQILFYLGIALSLLSLTNLTLLYKLSLGKVKGHMLLFIFVIIEIILLSYFSKDLLQFSIAFITASAAFLWGSIFLLNE
jgi:O-antigen/teichoic acid export membrane protein